MKLNRYIFHYERYTNHKRSAELAFEYQPIYFQIQEDLCHIMNYPYIEVCFMRDAFFTVIQCHRVLQWTQVFAYYRQDSLTDQQLELFKTWQINLERFTDGLHGHIEGDLNKFVDPFDKKRREFQNYRSKVIAHTENSKRFCASLLEGISEFDTSTLKL